MASTHNGTGHKSAALHVAGSSSLACLPPIRSSPSPATTSFKSSASSLKSLRPPPQQPHGPARAAVLQLLQAHPDAALSAILEQSTYGPSDGVEVHEWALAALGASGLFSQLQQITPQAGWLKLWAAAGPSAPESLTRPTIRLEPAVARTRRRLSGVKVGTDLHGGNLDLLRLCLGELPAWSEQQHAGAHASCDLVYVDSFSRIEDVPLREGQWCSRLEFMHTLADKAETERMLRRCRLLGMDGYEEGGCFPRCWLLPDELAEFASHLQHVRQQHAARSSSLGSERRRPPPTFIFKPSGGSEGAGIVLLQHENRIPAVGSPPIRRAVAQPYLRPLLLDGKKFDLRFYVLVLTLPRRVGEDVRLEAYLHREGLARFCTENYEEPSEANLTRVFAHLTNYSLNKLSTNFVRPCETRPAAGEGGGKGDGKGVGEVGGKGEGEGEDDADRPGHAAMRFDNDERPYGNSRFEGCSKRPASCVLEELAARGLISDEARLWKRIEFLAALVVDALEPDLALRFTYGAHAARKPPSIAEAAAEDSQGDAGGLGETLMSGGRFHILGLDVLIDADGTPQLLEINSRPSMVIAEGPRDSITGEELLGLDGTLLPKELFTKELSAVDCLVKRQVLLDTLRSIDAELRGTDNGVQHAAHANADAGVGADVGAGHAHPIAPPPPPTSASGTAPHTTSSSIPASSAAAPAACGSACGARRARQPSGFCRLRTGGGEGSAQLSLLNRARRLYEAAGAKPARAYANDGSCRFSPLGLSASHFVRFAGAAGLLQLEGLSKPGLEILFQQLCASPRRGERLGGPRSAVDPVVRMPFDAFVRALQEMASIAFPDLTARTRIEALFEHIALRGEGASEVRVRPSAMR